MGKAGRWLKSIIAGRKDGGGKTKSLPLQQQGDATPLPAASSPREKKRWSFRRPAPVTAHMQQGKAALAPSPLSLDPTAAGLSVSERELNQNEHAVAVAVAAAAAADAAVMAAAEAAAAVARLTVAEEESDLSVIFVVEEAAAARIQATFRGYLARKALCALRGLVKLQALIRGQLVRRQANATLRRMQALVDAQSRLRAQRARMVDADHVTAAAAAYQRRSPQHPRRRSSYEMDRSGEEHVKIVEMDMDEAARRGRSSCSAAASESRERRLTEYYYGGGGGGQCSPAPSSAAFGADLSPQRAYSGHFEDAFAFADHAATARSSPYVSPYDAAGAAADEYGAVPSYMANTESSRAKARSQSAPRQRTDAAAGLERQPSRRRGAPKKMMLRSSSHIGVPAAAACGYGYGYGYQQPPWAGVRLDRSSASLVGSECGSTSSVLTAATVGYCRSLVGFEVRGMAGPRPTF
ncbi:hypothetical protein BAE44_0024174 [Dichanthelium oligosanthes]|uniref:DUF4005 domain-containing protein n=1 Tax=Dichanthelium oligosanthes TaxID=888268 RepID=A0A1E5UPM0_9POAL|nr:hypothetical protein BAE44_0024174 [Dichanthelium oligosanthes]